MTKCELYFKRLLMLVLFAIPSNAFASHIVGLDLFYTHLTGNTYKVTASGVACAFAKSWATRLVKTPYRGEAGTHLTGPAGWSCLPTVSWGHGTPGSCSKGTARFGWGINAKSKI